MLCIIKTEVVDQPSIILPGTTREVVLTTDLDFFPSEGTKIVLGSGSTEIQLAVVRAELRITRGGKANLLIFTDRVHLAQSPELKMEEVLRVFQECSRQATVIDHAASW